MQPSLLVLALGALVAGHASGAAAMQEVRAVPPLSLQIVHLNDFHARFEPVSVKAGSCKVADECIGGLPRVAAAIAAERQRNPEALVLNGGDNFQGTLWYSLFRWNATAHFMNQIPWDALTVGNHEFDHGVAGLTPFMQHFNVAPIVVANMDDSQEPSMAGLWRPSVVVQKGGHKIGIVGYIWKETPSIARTEKLVFTDELAALDAEAGRLKREEDVDVVIALTHAGVEVDLAVAEGSQYADVIVGAHSHTLLYTGSPPAGDSAYGPYPLVVKQASGRTVLVVQASAYTKYLGNLTVHFDDAGEVAAWEGNPIYMGHDLPEDEAMAREMVPWGDEVAEQGLKVVGSSAVELDKTTYNCYSSECSLGNFVTDAMVDHYVGKGPAGSWTAAAVAFMNAGGLRTNIPPGDVTYGDLVAAQPFENTMDLIELQGKHLLELLEDSVDTLSLLHWSGLRVVFDYALPVRKRVVSSELLCADCEVPTYEPIDAERWYTVVAPSFIIEGGDNFQTVKNNFRNRIIGPVDMELFLEHLKTRSPLVTEMDGRLTVLRSARHGRWRRSAAATKTLFY